MDVNVITEVRSCSNVGVQGNPLSQILFKNVDHYILDARATSAVKLAALINKNKNLAESEEESLNELMCNYQDSSTSRPGKSKLLE
jgi:hypothetical protein